MKNCLGVIPPKKIQVPKSSKLITLHVDQLTPLCELQKLATAKNIVQIKMTTDKSKLNLKSLLLKINGLQEELKDVKDELKDVKEELVTFRHKEKKYSKK